VVLSHAPECREVGTRKVKAISGGRIGKKDMGVVAGTPAGRYEKGDPGYGDADGTETVPAWECVDGCPVAMLDAQSGTLKGCGSANVGSTGKEIANEVYGKGYKRTSNAAFVGQDGGASRFFYTAKASRREREAGLEGMPQKVGTAYSNGAGLSSGTDNPQQTPHKHEPVGNHHPTVKPLALMRWLCRLVTPPGGVILDPFTGSGSTGCAAVLEGFRFLGIEQEAEYVAIAERRIAHWAATVKPEPQTDLLAEPAA
jgi:hypothetical protein